MFLKRLVIGLIWLIVVLLLSLSSLSVVACSDDPIGPVITDEDQNEEDEDDGPDDED